MDMKKLFIDQNSIVCIVYLVLYKMPKIGSKILILSIFIGNSLKTLRVFIFIETWYYLMEHVMKCTQ